MLPSLLASFAPRTFRSLPSFLACPLLHSDPSLGALTPRILHLLPPLPPPSPLRSFARFLRPAPHLIVGSSPPSLLESFAPRIAPQILRSLPSLLASVALRTLRSLPSILAAFALRTHRSLPSLLGSSAPRILSSSLRASFARLCAFCSPRDVRRRTARREFTHVRDRRIRKRSKP